MHWNKIVIVEGSYDKSKCNLDDSLEDLFCPEIPNPLFIFGLALRSSGVCY